VTFECNLSAIWEQIPSSIYFKWTDNCRWLWLNQIVVPDSSIVCCGPTCSTTGRKGRNSPAAQVKWYQSFSISAQFYGRSIPKELFDRVARLENKKRKSESNRNALTQLSLRHCQEMRPDGDDDGDGIELNIAEIAKGSIKRYCFVSERFKPLG